MKNQPQGECQATVVMNDIEHENFSSHMFHNQTKTSPIPTTDLTPEFTDEERSIALQTIIQHMIQIYGYEATRNAFFISLFNHTLTLDTGKI